MSCVRTFCICEKHNAISDSVFHWSALLTLMAQDLSCIVIGQRHLKCVFHWSALLTVIVQGDFFASGSVLSCDWSILLPSGPVGVVSMNV